MRVKLPLLVLAAALTAGAQMKMSVDQLLSFIQSSIELRHQDKRVADYLGKVALTQRLDDSTIEDLQGAGAGPRTLEALRALRDASKNLPKRPVPAAKTPAPGIPPPSPAEQKRIMADLRDYALNYSKRLPDFICVQVTRRYVDPAGLEFWQRVDEVTTRLSFFEQKEDYKVILVNSRPTDIAYENLDGATSSGEFGTMLKEVFEEDTRASFAWERWATLRGKRAYVFSYRVARANSKWRLNYQRSLDYVSGYKGLIYVDHDNGMVMKITLEAEGIPPSFPIQQASLTLDYDYVDIAGQPYMLPLKSTMRMRESKLLVKNEVEFRLYRKFGADAVITFDTPDPLPEEQTKEQPVKP